MMGTRQDFNLGVMFRREHAPDVLPDFARRAEAAGFDELWVVEDCFYTSGIALAATALACTGSITVGLGIMPAVARNPVFTAMEIATLAGLFPGRFLPGLGHGVAGWMRQIGAFPRSQLVALEEVTIAVRGLLAGDRLSFEGNHVHLKDTQLVHPPDQVPPISLGVRGPKSLALSGRVADGTILAEYSGPGYVSWAVEQIAAGWREAGRGGAPGAHRLTVFAVTCVDSPPTSARRQVRPLVASAIESDRKQAHFKPLGIAHEAQPMLEQGGRERLAAEMPDEWIHELCIAGTPEECAAAVRRLVDAGADSVVLAPLPGKGVDELEKFAGVLLG